MPWKHFCEVSFAWRYCSIYHWIFPISMKSDGVFLFRSKFFLRTSDGEDCSELWFSWKRSDVLKIGNKNTRCSELVFEIRFFSDFDFQKERKLQMFVIEKKQCYSLSSFIWEKKRDSSTPEYEVKYKRSTAGVEEEYSRSTRGVQQEYKRSTAGVQQEYSRSRGGVQQEYSKSRGGVQQE